MNVEDVKRINTLAEQLVKENIADSMQEAVERAKKMILEQESRQGFAEKEVKETQKDLDKIEDKLERSLKYDEDLKEI
jgi:Na+-translocating ferredoxin:NAD+ oxidoreductase RnfG subunit